MTHCVRKQEDKDGGMIMQAEHELRAFGVPRYIDDLGRICLPMHMRKELEYERRQRVEVYVDNVGNIVIRKI